MGTLADAYVYHLAEADAWARALDGPHYVCPSLDQEGFIHCSRPDQVDATARRLYAGRSGMVLLKIDAASLGETLRYEAAADGHGVFPHVYGPIPRSAIVSVEPYIF